MPETPSKEERRRQKRERAIRRRAEGLLKQYLNGHQRRSYEARRAFRLRSNSIGGLRYEIFEGAFGARVTARLDPKIRATFSPPGLSPGIICRHRGALSTPSVDLCLQPTGALPAPDQALALKLFIDTDEESAWKMGTRMLRGLPPERLA